MQRPIPLLALALAAAACARLGLGEDAESRLRESFAQAVAATDSADQAYRNAIEATLPHESAHAMLSAMASFRASAQQTREAAVRELGEIWQRYNRSYGWFDPLDSAAAPTHGLNHVDATRAATISDRARSQVDALRERANESLLARLTPEQTETLRAEKLRRRDRFRAALATAFKAGLDTPLEPSRFESALDHLTSLTEGWY